MYVKEHTSKLHFEYLLEKMVITYRIHANKGRSELVATPLTFQVKNIFMSFLCSNLRPENLIFK